MSAPLLEIRDLKVHFPLRGGIGTPGGVVKAVDGISLDLQPGKTLALVGKSGCGKSTTAYAVVGLERATSGTIRFDGRNITALKGRERAALAQDIQIVFQDPSSALDPKMTIADSISEPLAIAGRSRTERKTRVAELLDRVGLPTALAERLPSALSGGQRQRVVIARALALSPRLLVLDEPVSALDVSIRSQVLNLLLELQRDLGLSYLFISHDLSVVRHIADEAMVLYLGTIAEQGPVDAIFERPQHPYTKALLSAIPLPDPRSQRRREKIILSGDLPSPLSPPVGCPFVTRCPERIAVCAEERFPLAAGDTGTEAACVHVGRRAG